MPSSASVAVMAKVISSFADHGSGVLTSRLTSGGVLPGYRVIEAFDEAAYRHWLAHRRVGGFSRSLGLYVHVPFCDTLCFYCACNKIAAKDRQKAVRYVDYLIKEIDLVAGALDAWPGDEGPTVLAESALVLEVLTGEGADGDGLGLLGGGVTAEVDPLVVVAVPPEDGRRIAAAEGGSVGALLVEGS